LVPYQPADGSNLEPKHVVVNKLIKQMLCVTDFTHKKVKVKVKFTLEQATNA